MIVSSTELFRVPNLFGIVCDGSAERVYPWGKSRLAYIYCMIYCMCIVIRYMIHIYFCMFLLFYVC